MVQCYMSSTLQLGSWSSASVQGYRVQGWNWCTEYRSTALLQASRSSTVGQVYRSCTGAQVEYSYRRKRILHVCWGTEVVQGYSGTGVV